MVDFEYLSIADFASAAGVSKQAVYKRVDKDLLNYSKVVDGKKYISTEALQLFNVKQPESEIEQHVDQLGLSALIAQLEEKDRMIQRQQEIISDQAGQITRLNEHIMEQSKASSDILQKQSQLQENFQVLLARQQELIEAQSTVKQLKQQVEVLSLSASQEHEKQENKGLFNRLFNRNK